MVYKKKKEGFVMHEKVREIMDDVVSEKLADLEILFDELVKSTINKIMKEKLTNSDYHKLSQTSNEYIQIALLQSHYVPETIKEHIISATCSDKVLEAGIKSETFDLNIIYNSFDRFFRDEDDFQRNYYIAQNIRQGRYFTLTHCNLIAEHILDKFLTEEKEYLTEIEMAVLETCTDNKIGQRIIQEEGYNCEMLLSAVINNNNFDDEIRTEAYRLGCNPVFIKKYSDEIRDDVFKSSIDTLQFSKNIEENYDGIINACQCLQNLMTENYLSPTQEEQLFDVLIKNFKKLGLDDTMDVKQDVLEMWNAFLENAMGKETIRRCLEGLPPTYKHFVLTHNENLHNTTDINALYMREYEKVKNGEKDAVSRLINIISQKKLTKEEIREIADLKMPKLEWAILKKYNSKLDELIYLHDTTKSSAMQTASDFCVYYKNTSGKLKIPDRWINMIKDLTEGFTCDVIDCCKMKKEDVGNVLTYQNDVCLVCDALEYASNQNGNPIRIQNAVQKIKDFTKDMHERLSLMKQLWEKDIDKRTPEEWLAYIKTDLIKRIDTIQDPATFYIKYDAIKSYTETLNEKYEKAIEMEKEKAKSIEKDVIETIPKKEKTEIEMEFLDDR